jgi:hypothetical protein
MLLCLHGRRRPPEASAGRGVGLASALMLIVAPCACALWSWLDHQRSPSASTGVPTVDIGRFFGGTAISAGYWLAASLWPAALHLVPGARIQGARPFPLPSVLSALNLVACLIAASAAIPLALRRGRELATDWLPAAAFLLLAAGYTAINVPWPQPAARHHPDTERPQLLCLHLRPFVPARIFSSGARPRGSGARCFRAPAQAHAACQHGGNRRDGRRQDFHASCGHASGVFGPGRGGSRAHRGAARAAW